jgi:hypothetical protein
MKSSGPAPSTLTCPAARSLPVGHRLPSGLGVAQRVKLSLEHQLALANWRRGPVAIFDPVQGGRDPSWCIMVDLDRLLEQAKAGVGAALSSLLEQHRNYLELPVTGGTGRHS